MEIRVDSDPYDEIDNTQQAGSILDRSVRACEPCIFGTLNVQLKFLCLLQRTIAQVLYFVCCNCA